MLSKINVRKYQNSDCEIISELFYDTVHSINAQDYTEKQLFAWARDKYRLSARREVLLEQNTLIAEIYGKIVGFGSIDKSGCLDLLFVHKDFQRQGIATALCDELERGLSVVTVYASITAKPFFEKRGYILIKAQEVQRLGIKLKNFEMRKNVKLSIK